MRLVIGRGQGASRGQEMSPFPSPPSGVFLSCFIVGTLQTFLNVVVENLGKPFF